MYAKGMTTSGDKEGHLHDLYRYRHNTTNSIENFNRQLRKVTKSKSIFPTDDALFKTLYPAMVDITKKWTGKSWDWGQTLDQFCIYFGDRIRPEDLI